MSEPEEKYNEEYEMEVVLHRALTSNEEMKAYGHQQVEDRYFKFFGHAIPKGITYALGAAAGTILIYVGHRHYTIPRHSTGQSIDQTDMNRIVNEMHEHES